MRPLSRVEAIREKAKRKFLDNMDQNGRPAWNVPELGNVAPPQGEISYGAETPLPGREKEYEEFKAYESQAGAQGGAPASFSAPPPSSIAVMRAFDASLSDSCLLACVASAAVTVAPLSV